jgi:hypothetical protein
VGFDGSRTGRDLVIAALIAFGVVAALFVDTRLERRTDDPTPAVHSVRWVTAADGGPSTIAPSSGRPGITRTR